MGLNAPRICVAACGNDIVRVWVSCKLTKFNGRSRMDLTLDQIRARFAAAKEDLYRRYPIQSLNIFGSYARNEKEPDSDIDILVEFSEPVGFEAADLAFALEELLGHSVDLVSRGAIRDWLRPYVEKDQVHV